jgi:hypothetical protein
MKIQSNCTIVVNTQVGEFVCYSDCKFKAYFAMHKQL